MKTPLKLCSVATGLLLLSACSGGSSNNTLQHVTCDDAQFLSANGKTCLTPIVSNITQEYIGGDNANNAIRFNLTGENLAHLNVAIDNCEAGKVISQKDTAIVYECTPKQTGESTLALSANNKKILSKTFTINKQEDTQTTSCGDTQYLDADGKTCLTPKVNSIIQNYISADKDNNTMRVTLTGENLAQLEVAIDNCAAGKVISKDDTTIVYECTPKQAGETKLMLSDKDKNIYSESFTIQEKEATPVSPATCDGAQFLGADGKTCLTATVNNITQEYINDDKDDNTMRFTLTGENLAQLEVAIDDCAAGKVISKDNNTIVYECTPKQAGKTILTLSNNGSRVYSQDIVIDKKEVAQPTSRLTATGMITCGNDLKNGLACNLLTGIWTGLQQDGLVRAGQAMSYKEMMVSGESCIKDNVTGLIWEKKTTSGLRSMNNTYSWYNTDNSTNGGDEGASNRGTCDGGANNALCDTQNYIAELNKQKYCGYNDWRLPTINELYSIANYNEIPSISTIFNDVQQEQQPEQFWWSSTPDNDEEGSGYAWAINYYDASSASKPNSRAYSVRAVRSDN